MMTQRYLLWKRTMNGKKIINFMIFIYDFHIASAAPATGNRIFVKAKLIEPKLKFSI